MPKRFDFSSDSPLPAVLLAYFQRAEAADLCDPNQGGRRLLAEADARALSGQLDFHPLVRILDGVALDDAGTSNHHFYVMQGPLCGSVFFLSHDEGSRVVYASLDDYLAQAMRARDEDTLIEDHHPESSPLAVDQPALATWIRQSARDGDADVIVPALLASLALNDHALLNELASHEDFYVAEAVAREIARRPHRSLKQVAGLCARHAHPQAAEAGRRALKWIDTLPA